MTQPSPTATLFTGRWIGETMEYDMPAHIWEIIQRGPRLEIRTRWEDRTRGQVLSGWMVPGQPAFQIGHFKASLVDPDHFIIPGWDTNDMRGGEGPDYDVVFSRPGLPELTARDAWLRFRSKAEP
jgi:hypothetical protein